jgi:hypothetical protein
VRLFHACDRLGNNCPRVKSYPIRTITVDNEDQNFIPNYLLFFARIFVGRSYGIGVLVLIWRFTTLLEKKSPCARGSRRLLSIGVERRVERARRLCDVGSSQYCTD